MVLAASAFIVAAVLGSAWMTGQFTTPAVDRTDGYVSELAARDQPWTRLFRISQALSGLACLGGVALVPRVAREWPGWLALAAFGLLSFASGVFPLDCATLSDPTCGLRGTSFAHQAHTVAGVLGALAVLAAMALLGARWGSWVAWMLTWLSLAATVLTLAGLVGGHGVGLAHRALLTMIAVWLVYVALHLLVAEDPDDPYALDAPRIAPGRLGGVGSARVRTEDAARAAGQGRPASAERVDWRAGRGRSASAEGADRAAGQRRSHVVEQGAGPAVLITVGPGGAWFHWDAVAVRLARSRRVIRFDRPGLGLSPGSPAPPSLYGEVARLAALAPAHPEQVTLVAHGVACWHAEAFARLHPLRLAGLVLVDPVCAARRRPLPTARAAGRWLPALGETWGATAVARLTGPATHRLLTGLPDLSRIYSRGKVCAAMAGEWLARRDMAADLHRLRAEMRFPDVPVTVISVGDPGGCPERLAGELGAAHVRMAGSGGRIQLHEPGAVADAVLAASS
ncbi:hypothetical protein GCM10022224_063830 [Nonomuraea antimicrobica]|uniref:AB hydrolase-1 domain-containing protein n=1 Tax=Nonomuraea antimicrobica TaxID=561173 RepID=A0ABP7CJQ7_9ACTN